MSGGRHFLEEGREDGVLHGGGIVLGFGVAGCD